MKLPLSWLNDYVETGLAPLELARTLTMLGMEVEEIHLIGLPNPYEQDPTLRREFKIDGLPWDPEKFVVAQVNEVLPHPNADRLVLCKLDDGHGERIVLTGAPNLYPYKGSGPLHPPLKVAYAKEGARLYDGHQDGYVLTTLKKTKIRGVDSDSMVCSEKELGISDEHEGIMLLPADAPTGAPLADYLGDAVFEVNILPNMARNASVLGIAREVAAATGCDFFQPLADLHPSGAPIEGQAHIHITDPALNPRFVLGLIREVTIGPSPAIIQQRLRLAGMRPINNVVDVTNYVMLLTGQPLHAFDYDVLLQRAGGQAPTILTRPALPGEKLTTLDGVERELDPFTIMVCDTAGALSLAGVMGGQESEVTDSTRTILLEGASWNFINVRRTLFAQKLTSEAGYRFARGVHPALAEQAVRLALAWMADWSGGQVAPGLVDAYPAPVTDPLVTLTEDDVQRILGVRLPADEIADLLGRLDFTCSVHGQSVTAQTPPTRLDIGTGVVGKADLIEEVARLYGYDRLPITRLPDEMPAAHNRPALALEARARDALVRLGLQEVVNYRLTSPEREARLSGKTLPPEAYIVLKNPLTPERSVMRRSLLASLLDALEKNARLAGRLAFFEVGPVFWPREGAALPDEPQKLALALTGLRLPPAWDRKDDARLDFFDLKAAVEGLLDELHIRGAAFVPAADERFHPGKCAAVQAEGLTLGVLGELHPQVKARYDFLAAPVLAAEFDLAALLAASASRYESAPVPVFPPVLEDLALVVDETVPAEHVAALIRQTGGKLLRDVRLFDVFRSEQIGAGKVSLAYSLTYQSQEGTLTDAEVKSVRQRIIRRLEQEIGAKLRS